MYYFVDMHDDKLNFLNGIEESSCLEVAQASDTTKDVLEYYFLGKCVAEAWDQLALWSSEANSSGNYLMRNLHTAERLVRNFLFEFRTCLDHMETDIKQKHGEKSDLWEVFREGTSKAYDDHLEYAFTYHLRNCSQHCKNVVHGFNSTTNIGLSSNTERLLAEYSRWNQVDKRYMQKVGKEIDLLKTFSIAFSAFNTALAPVIQHMLNTNGVGGELSYLRQWGEWFTANYKHSVHAFHVVKITFKDGKEATKEDMSSGDVIVNAYPIDWGLVYELTDSITQHKTL